MKRKIFTWMMLALLSMGMTYAVNGSLAAQVDAEELFIDYEKKPEFPGGQTALERFIKNHLRHPVSVRESNLNGRVVCEFIVNKDGSISDIEVVRSNYSAMNDEVVRMLQEMPRWEPATSNGEPVSARYVLPVQFHLP
ncbi:MAG: energy transducer TonB [Paludibacteraceae bacterium]|nr:energy transducer TonB [Paludibacteraceae bacterium]